MLFDRHRHIRQHRRALRTGDREQVGKTCDREPQIGAGAVRPGVVQRAAAAALDVQGLQRTGERIKAGGEHDDVEFELLAAGTDSLFRDFLDRAVSVGIDQQHAVLVEGLVIVGVQRRSLGAEWVLLRHQLLGNRRILDHPADLVAEIVGDDFIGFPAEQHILIVAQPEDEAADVPHPLEFALSFLGGRLERRFRNAGQFEPRERVPRALDDRVVIGFAGGYSLRVDLAVARRQAVVRSPLENRQLFCLLSYLWDRPYGAGAGAYDRDALGGKIDAAVREPAGVIPFAAKPLQALEWWQVGVGKGAAAVIRKRAVTASPASVPTFHRPLASSNWVPVTRVLKQMSRFRSWRAATCSR